MRKTVRPLFSNENRQHPKEREQEMRDIPPSTPIESKEQEKAIPDNGCLVAIPARARTRRDPFRRRAQDIALDEALAEFHGSRGDHGKCCDQNIWGNFIAAKGVELFLDCVAEARSEIRQKRRAPPDYVKPRILQQILNRHWR